MKPPSCLSSWADVKPQHPVILSVTCCRVDEPACRRWTWERLLEVRRSCRHKTARNKTIMSDQMLKRASVPWEISWILLRLLILSSGMGSFDYIQKLAFEIWNISELFWGFFLQLFARNDPLLHFCLTWKLFSCLFRSSASDVKTVSGVVRRDESRDAE